jgi:TRAP-type C4-dicarboxylate transport system substrate-binding protein
MTENPISYIIGVLAVQKKAFDKLSTEDQAVVREEISKVFGRLDELNRSDNLAAKAALKQQGITFVAPDPGEVERWKSISDGAIDEMAASGTISPEIVSQVREYLQSFRSSQ